MIAGVAVALIILTMGALGSKAAAGSPRVQWFQAKLASGEINGYRWSVGAKGRMHEPLSQICTQISIVEPPRDDVPYVEGSDATDCGRLNLPTDAVSSTDSLGAGESGVTVLETIYRPLVRKVTIVFATGKRKVYRTRVPQLSNRADRGIPMFRYIAVSFNGEDCIGRVIAFDGRGRVVSNQTRPPC
jgi:hypothetical protein